MKVFLSWSGELSKKVALALRLWLPEVIQALDPWMSSEDIEKGSMFISDIAKQLLETKAGIICVTPDNQRAQWLNFEAGALSRTVDATMVCPYLFGLKPNELRGPLIQFQAAESTKADTLKLLTTLNKVISKPLPDGALSAAFERCWPELEKKLGLLTDLGPDADPKRSAEDMLEEVIDTVREQTRMANQILYQIQIQQTQAQHLNQIQQTQAQQLKMNELILGTSTNSLSGAGPSVGLYPSIGYIVPNLIQTRPAYFTAEDIRVWSSSKSGASREDDKTKDERDSES